MTCFGKLVNTRTLGGFCNHCGCDNSQLFSNCPAVAATAPPFWDGKQEMDIFSKKT